MLTREGTAAVAYIGQPLRGERALYQINGSGPSFAATHPFINAAETEPNTITPALLALDPSALTSSVPTLSNDGVSRLHAGSQLLSRPTGATASPSTATVHDINDVPPGPDDTYLYDVHLEPGTGTRQEFWAGRDAVFYLTVPEFPIINQAGPAAATLVALMEGLLASEGIDHHGWPDWVINAINQFGAGVFHGALTEALAATPSFGAPPPKEPLETRITRLYGALEHTSDQTGAVVASLFDGQLAAVGQWLSSAVSLGWRAAAEPGGNVLTVGVFDLALTPESRLPIDHSVCLTVAAHGQTTTEATCMWDHRGRANTRFHRIFDQLAHIDRHDDPIVELVFTATIDGSDLPVLQARVPRAADETGYGLQSAVLRDPFGAAAGQIRFDTRLLGQASASKELADSGLWTDQDAYAYADALGTAMVTPTLTRLQALASSANAPS